MFGPNETDEVQRFYSNLEPGAPRLAGGLGFVPLLGGPSDLDAVLLEEALLSDAAQVTEVSAGGSVNAVRVLHRGDRPLLLVDGEHIVGAKQNRVFNASFVIAPGQEAVVPVSCVEQGRWHEVSGTFRSSGSTLTSAARSSKLRRVARSVTTSGLYDADQGAVWTDTAAFLRRTRTCSPTSAFYDGLRSRESEVAEHLEILAPEPGQMGLAAMAGGELVQMDVFGSPSLYERGWRKIALGALTEVHDRPTTGRSDLRAVVAFALKQAARASITRRQAPGGGVTLHGASQWLTLCAAVHQKRVYHTYLVPN